MKKIKVPRPTSPGVQLKLKPNSKNQPAENYQIRDTYEKLKQDVLYRLQYFGADSAQYNDALQYFSQQTFQFSSQLMNENQNKQAEYLLIDINKIIPKSNRNQTFMNLSQLAQCFHKQNRQRTSLKYLKQSIEHTNQKSEVYSNMSYLYYVMSNYDGAFKYITQALREAIYEVEFEDLQSKKIAFIQYCYKNRGHILELQKKVDLAIQNYMDGQNYLEQKIEQCESSPLYQELVEKQQKAEERQKLVNSFAPVMSRQLSNVRSAECLNKSNRSNYGSPQMNDSASSRMARTLNQSNPYNSMTINRVKSEKSKVLRKMRGNSASSQKSQTASLKSQKVIIKKNKIKVNNLVQHKINVTESSSTVQMSDLNEKIFNDYAPQVERVESPKTREYQSLPFLSQSARGSLGAQSPIGNQAREQLSLREEMKRDEKRSVMSQSSQLNMVGDEQGALPSNSCQSTLIEKVSVNDSQLADCQKEESVVVEEEKKEEKKEEMEEEQAAVVIQRAFRLKHSIDESAIELETHKEIKFDRESAAIKIQSQFRRHQVQSNQIASSRILLYRGVDKEQNYILVAYYQKTQRLILTVTHAKSQIFSLSKKLNHQHSIIANLPRHSLLNNTNYNSIVNQIINPLPNSTDQLGSIQLNQPPIRNEESLDDTTIQEFQDIQNSQSLLSQPFQDEDPLQSTKPHKESNTKFTFLTNLRIDGDEYPTVIEIFIKWEEQGFKMKAEIKESSKRPEFISKKYKTKSLIQGVSEIQVIQFIAKSFNDRLYIENGKLMEADKAFNPTISFQQFKKEMTQEIGGGAFGFNRQESQDSVFAEIKNSIEEGRKQEGHSKLEKMKIEELKERSQRENSNKKSQRIQELPNHNNQPSTQLHFSNNYPSNQLTSSNTHRQPSRNPSANTQQQLSHPPTTQLNQQTSNHSQLDQSHHQPINLQLSTQSSQLYRSNKSIQIVAITQDNQDFNPSFHLSKENINSQNSQQDLSSIKSQKNMSKMSKRSKKESFIKSQVKSSQSRIHEQQFQNSQDDQIEITQQSSENSEIDRTQYSNSHDPYLKMIRKINNKYYSIMMFEEQEKFKVTLRQLRPRDPQNSKFELIIFEDELFEILDGSEKCAFEFDVIITTLMKSLCLDEETNDVSLKLEKFKYEMYGKKHKVEMIKFESSNQQKQEQAAIVIQSQYRLRVIKQKVDLMKGKKRGLCVVAIEFTESSGLKQRTLVKVWVNEETLDLSYKSQKPDIDCHTCLQASSFLNLKHFINDLSENWTVISTRVAKILRQVLFITNKQLRYNIQQITDASFSTLQLNSFRTSILSQTSPLQTPIITPTRSPVPSKHNTSHQLTDTSHEIDDVADFQLDYQTQSPKHTKNTEQLQQNEELEIEFNVQRTQTEKSIMDGCLDITTQKTFDPAFFEKKVFTPKEAAIKIQNSFRSFVSSRNFKQLNQLIVNLQQNKGYRRVKDTLMKLNSKYPDFKGYYRMTFYSQSMDEAFYIANHKSLYFNLIRINDGGRSGQICINEFKVNTKAFNSDETFVNLAQDVQQILEHFLTQTNLNDWGAIKSCLNDKLYQDEDDLDSFDKNTSQQIVKDNLQSELVEIDSGGAALH